MDIPSYGDDTLWANTVRAYETLSETMKTMLEPLKGHMSGRRILAAMKNSGAGANQAFASMDLDPNEQDLFDSTHHPLVRTHPVTNKRSLYVDESYAIGAKGLSKYEAELLVTFLCRHITQPIFSCRLRWEKNTFVMWDNRSCLHHAFNDRDGFRREMLRTIVAAETPC